MKNDWLNNPVLKNIDPIKLELIKTAASQTMGKNGNDLAPILMSLITNANKKGIKFTPDEMSLVIELTKEGKPQKERDQIDKTLKMVSSLMQKKH